MWTAPVAFTSLINTPVLQLARTPPTIGGCPVPGQLAWASLVCVNPNKKNLRKMASLSAFPRKCLGRVGSCRPDAELTQLVTAATAHLCRWVWEGEQARAWEEAGEEQMGKIRRQSSTQPDRVNPSGVYAPSPSPTLKLQRTQTENVKAHV